MKLEYCDICNTQTNVFCGRVSPKNKVGAGMYFSCSLYSINNKNYFLLSDISEQLYRQGLSRIQIKELIIKDISE